MVLPKGRRPGFGQHATRIKGITYRERGGEREGEGERGRERGIDRERERELEGSGYTIKDDTLFVVVPKGRRPGFGQHAPRIKGIT